MWTRKELKEKGKLAFKANYWKCVLVALLLGICSGAGGSSGGGSGKDSKDFFDFKFKDGIKTFKFHSVDPAIVALVAVAVLMVLCVGIALKIFVFNPLSIGCYRFFVINSDETAELSELGYGFKYNYMNVVKILFFKDLYVFLWTLLFIIPGIVKSFEYFQIPYLLADDSSISMEEAFSITKERMTGNKWSTFVLELSFIGWYFLGALSFGILLVFYVSPYVQTTFAELYKVIGPDKKEENYSAIASTEL